MSDNSSSLKWRKPMRVVLSGLLWLLVILLLFWAINLKDPHLLPYRQYETAVLLVLTGSGFAAFWYYARGINRITGLTLLAVIMLLTVVAEIAFRYHKATVLSSEQDAVREVGRHFLVGYSRMNELRPLVSKGLVGGVFITQRNAVGKSVEDLRTEIYGLQQLRNTAGLPPLIIATDQEGGMVSRLSPPLVQRPPLAELVADNRSDAQVEAEAEQYGTLQGKELAKLGVTINFSPVVDLKSDRADNPLDFHSLINRRAISKQPAMTARVAQAYVRGLESQGVHATLKHFPGLGRVVDDTHHFSAALDASITELDAHDWIPFKEVARGSGALIMLSHVILSHLDSENPVSFSRTVVQSVIRGAWQHQGILITDDLTMGAAYNRGLCDATIKALNAGVDLLLVSYDDEKYYDAMYCAMHAYEKGLINKDLLKRSRARLQQLQKRH